MFIAVVILLAFFLLYGILIDYYRRAWVAIPPVPRDRSQEQKGEPPTSISVIIPARNEEKNILACLDSLFLQSYPKNRYQVIVVDDQSTDRTWEILRKIEYPGMQILPLQLADYLPDNGNIRAYKKFSIETGIGMANGDLIITTDADCRFHRDWLRTVAAFYEQTGAQFLAAPVRIDAGPSFLAVFQTLDFITLQGITGAAVYKRFHSMCNGANLAYPRKAFREVGGYQGIDGIPSGDDMLLMHKIYKKYPAKVFFLKDRRAIVTTKAETTWKGFFNQRIRWASKADKYDDKRIFAVLLGVFLLNLSFPVLLLASCWNRWWLLAFFLLLFLKTVIEYPFVRTVAAFFDQQRLCVYFPLLQPFHIFYTVGVGWLGKFGSYQWKGRKINS
ncbi:MAG: glycosyltransferase [Puia sp.]|nr:glycosyltransferase [Puia sp.]